MTATPSPTKTDALTRLRAVVKSLNSPQSKRRDTQSAVLYEARREAAGILADLDWRDISTAPKDGTEIIGLFCRRYDESDPPTIYGPWTIAYDGRKWRSSWDGQEVIDYMSDFGTEYKGPDIDPTHWQPLPEPPAIAVKTDQETAP